MDTIPGPLTISSPLIDISDAATRMFHRNLFMFIAIVKVGFASHRLIFSLLVRDLNYDICVRSL